MSDDGIAGLRTVPITAASVGDIDYYEARRKARALLGQHADVMKLERPLSPALVGVYSEVAAGRREFVVVGSGQSYVEALDDARRRQKTTPTESTP